MKMKNNEIEILKNRYFISKEQQKICDKYHTKLIRPHFSSFLKRLVYTCPVCRWEEIMDEKVSSIIKNSTK